MSLYAVTPSELMRASASTAGAGSDAQSAHSSEAFTALASGLPGSTTAEIAPGIASSLEEGVTGWADDVEGFADDLELTAADGSVSDELVGTHFAGLGYILTGES